MAEHRLDRTDHTLPLSLLREQSRQNSSTHRDTVPHRQVLPYVTVKETGGKLGFSPMTTQFLRKLHRVRLTAPAQLYMCLGPGRCRQILRTPLRASERQNRKSLSESHDESHRGKPRGHDFLPSSHERPGAASRLSHMSVTGG